MQNVITVTKTVTNKVPADTAHIFVTASATSPDAAQSAHDAAAIAVEVVKVLSMHAVTAHSDGACTYPQYDKNAISDYRTDHSFTARVGVEGETLSAVLSALSKLNVSWRVSYAFEGKSERENMLREAVKKAHDDAKLIAAAAGVKLGKLFGVDYASDNPSPLAMRCMSAAPDSAEPKDITLSETVTCAWSIKD